MEGRKAGHGRNLATRRDGCGGNFAPLGPLMDHLRSSRRSRGGASATGEGYSRGVFFIEMSASGVQRGVGQLSTHFFLGSFNAGSAGRRGRLRPFCTLAMARKWSFAERPWSGHGNKFFYENSTSTEGEGDAFPRPAARDLLSESTVDRWPCSRIHPTSRSSFAVLDTVKEMALKDEKHSASGRLRTWRTWVY